MRVRSENTHKIKLLDTICALKDYGNGGATFNVHPVLVCIYFILPSVYFLFIFFCSSLLCFSFFYLLNPSDPMLPFSTGDSIKLLMGTFWFYFHMFHITRKFRFCLIQKFPALIFFLLLRCLSRSFSNGLFWLSFNIHYTISELQKTDNLVFMYNIRTTHIFVIEAMEYNKSFM